MLVVSIISTPLYPTLTNAQVFGEESSFDIDTNNSLPSDNLDTNSFGIPGSTGSNPLLENTVRTNSDGSVDVNSIGNISNPRYNFGTDNPFVNVEPISGPTQNSEACLTSLAQDSIINTMIGSLGDQLSGFGLDSLFSEAMSGLGGAGGFGNGLQNVIIGTLAADNIDIGSFTGDIGGAISGALGDIGSTLSGGFGGVLGGLGGFGGASEVPVGDQLNRENTSDIRAQERSRNAINVGDGGISVDGIAWCLANQAIEGIVAGTVDWVNTGFDGNPAFIDNPEKFFGDIADYELGLMLDEISGGLLCSNIKANVTNNLVDNYRTNNNLYNRERRKRCTLSDITDNVEAFANGDFSQGGWDSWLEYTTNPYNNHFGAQIEIQRELDSRISRSQSVAGFELELNDGFQSIRDPLTGDITTPGSLIKSQVTKRLNAPVDRITFADEFDELTNSLIDNFVKISVGELIGDIF